MTNYGSYLLETFLMLVCVCGAAWAILFGARKLGFGRAKGPISLLGQLPLEARRSIFLVRIGPRVLVVGASEAGLSKLSELEAKELLASDGAQTASRERAEGPFRDVLAKVLAKPRAETDLDAAEEIIARAKDIPGDPPRGDDEIS